MLSHAVWPIQFFFFHGTTDPVGKGLPWMSDQTDGRYLYLTTQNIHTRQTSMPLAGFEPGIPSCEQPQTHTLDCVATGIGLADSYTTVTYQTTGWYTEESCMFIFTAFFKTSNLTQPLNLYYPAIYFKSPWTIRLVANFNLEHDISNTGQMDCACNMTTAKPINCWHQNCGSQ